MKAFKFMFFLCLGSLFVFQWKEKSPALGDSASASQSPVELLAPRVLYVLFIPALGFKE